MLFRQAPTNDDGTPLAQQMDGTWRTMAAATEYDIYSAIKKVRWYEGPWVKKQPDLFRTYILAAPATYISWSAFSIAKGATETWATSTMFGYFVMLNTLSLVVTAGIHTYSILNGNYYLNWLRRDMGYRMTEDNTPVIHKEQEMTYIFHWAEFILLMFEAGWISGGYTITQASLFEMYGAFINTWEIAAISGAISGCVLGMGESLFALPGVERGGLPHICRIMAYTGLGVASTIVGAYLAEWLINTGIAPNPSLYGYMVATVTLPIFCIGKLLLHSLQEVFVTLAIEKELATQGKYVKQLYPQESEGLGGVAI